MFRSKKKNLGGRKRRDVEVESRDEVFAVLNDVEKQPTGTILPLSKSEEVESDLHMLENLRRSRTRPIRSAMTFRSKCTLDGSSGRSGHTVDTAVFSTETIGKLLSFDDGEHQKKQKKRKMRPNLVASSTVDLEVEKDMPSQYSAEMLSSLRNEQSVQCVSQRKELQEDVEMHEVERESDKRSKVMEEEDGNFIAFEGETKKKLYSKSRVTFGNQTNGPQHSKTTEVVEEVSAEEEDEDQTKRWEEELMRRGGHLMSVAPEAKERYSRDGPFTYPTRRKVTCVSLGSVISKLEKSLEATTAEDERVSGEIVRLKAETALIEKTLKQHQEELLDSCEEFEYFQEVEDFVKGLSFCLREKLPEIQAKEQNILDERVRRVKTLHQEEKNGINEELRLWLHSGILQQSDIFGLDHIDVKGTAVELLTNDTQLAVRMDKYRQHFTETYVADLYPEEENLFFDAIDEINSLERVYGKFQEWNAKFPEVYKSTYCELAQEKLFAPYVMAELLYWDPLSVASAKSKFKSFDDFTWYRVLRQHVRQLSVFDTVDGPMLYQIRNVLLTKVRVAVSSYFDPYSCLQVRSLLQVLEEINRHGFFAHVKEAVTTLVNTALEAFVSATKCTMLVAIDQTTATAHKDVNLFAHYLLERFNTLQDNLLTLFVGLPKGLIASAGFRSLLQVLHQLLAYIRFCREMDKVQLIATATQVVRQLSGSSYVYQILSDPKQERELIHMIALFTPFLHNADHQM